MTRTDCHRISARLATLSDREREVLSHVVSGEGNNSVASKLGVTVKTIEAHRSHIMRKTGARGVAELVQFQLSADRQGAVNTHATCYPRLAGRARELGRSHPIFGAIDAEV